ncbi:MAG: hypothetical protein EBU63_06790, partial [Alphaproteobacteria bacterium]|nr:hypothetical protein [Alphaproteobacteria bacterium]
MRNRPVLLTIYNSTTGTAAVWHPLDTHMPPAGQSRSLAFSFDSETCHSRPACQEPNHRTGKSRIHREIFMPLSPVKSPIEISRIKAVIFDMD